MTISLRDSSPEAALLLLDQLEKIEDRFSPEFETLDFGEWPQVHVYIPHPEVSSSITPPFMEAFLELQKQIYQLAAQASAGVADSGQLSDGVRAELQISVLVTDGSSNLTAKLEKIVPGLLKQMIGKLDGKQAAIVLVAVRSSNKQPACVGHCTEVRCDVDRVGNKQQQDERPDGRRRKISAYVAGDAVPGNPADASRYFLNCNHEGIAQKQRPADAETDLRAGLAVGPDTRWIIVGSAGDQAWTEARDEARLLIFVSCFRLAACHCTLSLVASFKTSPPSAKRRWRYGGPMLARRVQAGLWRRRRDERYIENWAEGSNPVSHIDRLPCRDR